MQCLVSIILKLFIKYIDVFLDIVPEAAVGKILIQRNEETKEAVLFYSKLPPLHGKTIVLLDPMLATGGSAVCAIEVLVNNGADARNIFFVNVVSCPEGIHKIENRFPEVTVFSGEIDVGLDHHVL